MEEVRDRARLVDVDAFGERRVTATIPRSEIEDILRSDEGSPELQLNILRRDGGDAEAHMLELDWEPQELEELLRRTDGDDVTLVFDESDLESLLRDIEVEAHGIRERAVVLAVAAATAATTAGAARAVPLMVEDSSGGGAAAPIAMVSDAASSGPVAAPEMISDAAMTGAVEAQPAAELVSDAGLSGPRPIATTQQAELVSDAGLSGPRPVPTTQQAELVSDAALSGPRAIETAELASASGGSGISAPDPATTGAIVGGAALALTAAFAMRRRRSHDDAARPV